MDTISRIVRVSNLEPGEPPNMCCVPKHARDSLIGSSNPNAFATQSKGCQAPFGRVGCPNKYTEMVSNSFFRSNSGSEMGYFADSGIKTRETSATALLSAPSAAWRRLQRLVVEPTVTVQLLHGWVLGGLVEAQEQVLARLPRGKTEI